jgi:hypothetical protein
MKYLLVAKFQGALLGCQVAPISRRVTVPNQLFLDSTSALSGGAESIIRSGRVNLDDWFVAATPVRHESVAVVATLPLMLVCHDNWREWQDMAIAIGRYWQLRAEVTASIFTIGYFISHAVREDLDPLTVISRLLADVPSLPPQLSEQLVYINDRASKSASLHQVVEDLMQSPDPIVTGTILAIYSWLTTPDCYDLTLRRSLAANYHPNFTCAVAGMLSGSYLSLTGINIDRTIVAPQSERWMMLGQQLYGTWAGVYDPNHIDHRQISAIGSANSIQRR